MSILQVIDAMTLKHFSKAINKKVENIEPEVI
jgi:hypothetical protein